MPVLISRERALQKLAEEPEHNCFLCRLSARDNPLGIFVNDEVAVVLSAYPRFWGQLMIIPVLHFENYTELPAETWTQMNHLAHVAARVLETILKPARCYIASTGAPQQLPMTGPHIHINVLPVNDPTLKPTDVFTWSHGVYEGSSQEWSALRETLKAAWPQ